MKPTEEEIYDCVRNYWEDDCLMIGEQATKTLIKDVVENRQPNIRTISGGHSFVLVESLALIVSVSALLLQGVQFYYDHIKEKNDKEKILKLLFDSIKEKVEKNEIDFETFKNALQYMLKKE